MPEGERNQIPASLRKTPMTKTTRLYANTNAAAAAMLPSKPIVMIHSSHPPTGIASIFKPIFGDTTGTWSAAGGLEAEQ